MSQHEYEGIDDELQMQQWFFNRQMMEGLSAADHGSIHGARLTLGFPLGTALILLIVFGISALFSCCYHWEKIRSMHSRHHDRHSSSQPTARHAHSTPTATASPLSSAADWSNPRKNSRLQQSRSSLPVMMPGDDVPKFMAMPSPHGFAPLSIGDNGLPSTHFNQTKRSRP